MRFPSLECVMILGHTKQLAEKSTEPGFDELFAIGPLIGNIV